MAEQPSSWTDPSTLVGGGGLLAIIGAAIKVVFDYRRDKGQQRQSGQDELADNLMATVTAQSAQITSLYKTIGEMQGAIRECEARAIRFQTDVAELRQENVGLRFRTHGLLSWLSTVPSLPDLPAYLTGPIEGPTQREAVPKPPEQKP